MIKGTRRIGSGFVCFMDILFRNKGFDLLWPFAVLTVRI